ncbi:MAG: PEP-CTERM sorting domain-containing protein [Betaproteobacteria bacterium]|nr:PEP-CTERM sorting domain-containing protein [Betaproteobacteria bacterium]
MTRRFIGKSMAGAIALGLSAGTQAALIQVNVTVENLAPANSVRFAPLRVGFHGGVFDSFDIGAPAAAPIVSIAEGGSGSAWFPAFAAADAGAVLGTAADALLPGQSDSATFAVDPATNPYFTFASMVVPSNDFFVGNDDPQQYRLFGASGNLLVSAITQRSRDLWDAGSEIHDPAAAAFVGNNDLRADQNSVVALNFAEFAAFDGMLTAAGYIFQSQLAADTEIYRISFAVTPVPEPHTYVLMALGLALVGWVGSRRTTSSTAT